MYQSQLSIHQSIGSFAVSLRPLSDVTPNKKAHCLGRASARSYLHHPFGRLPGALPWQRPQWRAICRKLWTSIVHLQTFTVVGMGRNVIHTHAAKTSKQGTKTGPENSRPLNLRKSSAEHHLKSLKCRGFLFPVLVSSLARCKVRIVRGMDTHCPTQQVNGDRRKRLWNQINQAKHPKRRRHHSQKISLTRFRTSWLMLASPTIAHKAEHLSSWKRRTVTL